MYFVASASLRLKGSLTIAFRHTITSVYQTVYSSTIVSNEFKIVLSIRFFFLLMFLLRTLDG